MDITLQLSTFILRSTQMTRKLSQSLIEVIAALQDEINFQDIVSFLVCEGMSSELIILALNSQLKSQTRDQIAFLGLRTAIEHENYALAIELWEHFGSILLQKR